MTLTFTHVIRRSLRDLGKGEHAFNMFITSNKDVPALDASSQRAGPGASHLSELDSNGSLPNSHRTESTPTVGHQDPTVMILLEMECHHNANNNTVCQKMTRNLDYKHAL